MTSPAGSCGYFNEAAAYHCGKRQTDLTRPGEQATSMRPQHITAENSQPQLRLGDTIHHFNEAAAYHCGKRRRRTPHAEGRRHFNEAAAYHCGKRRPAAGVIRPGADTSMRPQHITAENCGTRCRRR